MYTYHGDCTVIEFNVESSNVMLYTEIYPEQ